MTKKRTHIDLGVWGESLAAEYLIRKGYRIIARNYENFIGEIDIIAMQDRVLCFVEVKTREGDQYGSPFESVTLQKQKKIVKVAQVYLLENGIEDQDCRFDVVSILLEGNYLKKIEIIEDAFDLD